MLILEVIGMMIIPVIILYLLGTLMRLYWVFSQPYEKLNYEDKYFKIKVNFWLLKYFKINKKLK
jgi:hypothetical protein